MKRSIVKTVCIICGMLLMSSFAIRSQNMFYDIKRDVNGRMISKIKYVKGIYGACVADSSWKYSYDEKGVLLKKEVSIWEPTYKVNKRGIPFPDYAESNWKPLYCIQHKKDSINNFEIIELLVWNKERNSYDIPSNTMIYHLKDSNRYDYLVFRKGKEYIEKINDINYNGSFTSELANKVSRIDLDRRLSKTNNETMPYINK